MTTPQGPVHTPEIQKLFSELSFLNTSRTVGSKELVRGLFELYSRASSELERVSTTDNFARAWIVRAVVQQLLQYGIEDDYIELDRTQRQEISSALQSLAQGNHWPGKRIIEALATCRDVATRTPMMSQLVEVTLTNNLRIIGRIAPAGQPQFQVSSKTYPFVPILDDCLSDPFHVNQLATAYAQHLRLLKEEFDINALCFVEKDVGPVGALAMASFLVGEAQMPATIYRMNHWSPRARLAGHMPNPTDRYAIVYDLLVTGEGVLNVAKDLTSRFGAAVPAAVILFGYEQKRASVLAGEAKVDLKVLGWYNDFAADIEELRRNQRESRYLKFFHAHKGSSLQNRTAGVDSTKEESMPSIDECVGAVVIAIEDLGRRELMVLAQNLFAGNTPQNLGSGSLKKLRKILMAQAENIYYTQPAALNSARLTVRKLLLEALNKSR